MQQTTTSFSVRIKGSTVIIRGTLGVIPANTHALREVLSQAIKLGQKITIEAKDLWVSPEGLGTWYNLVQELRLEQVEIYFTESQLGDFMFLEDEVYPKWTFSAKCPYINSKVPPGCTAVKKVSANSYGVVPA
jgi:hypothetical protein